MGKYKDNIIYDNSVIMRAYFFYWYDFVLVLPPRHPALQDATPSNLGGELFTVV